MTARGGSLTRRIHFEAFCTIIRTSDTLLCEESFKIEEVGLLNLVLEDFEPDRTVGSCMGTSMPPKTRTSSVPWSRTRV